VRIRCGAGQGILEDQVHPGQRGGGSGIVHGHLEDGGTQRRDEDEQPEEEHAEQRT
jgi:hypothetical protein